MSYVCLGRFGDIINTLPMAWEDSRICGPVDWIVAEDFAGVLEGCSYVRPVVFKGKYYDLQGAVKQFKERYSELRIVQPWSQNYPGVSLGDSFVKSAWAQVGRRGWPGKLMFDRRNLKREERLFATMLMGHEPMVQAPILVALDSTSSPFQHRRELLDSLKAKFGPRVWTLDPNATRIYDLLGLFDAAACLVTVDTAHLHLSWAVPRLPVIALIADTPTMWHGTACRPNQAFRCRYGEYPSLKEELLEAVGTTLKHHIAIPNLIHCYSEYDRGPRSQALHDGAAATWDREYESCRWKAWPVEGISRKFEHRELPAVKDILDSACQEANLCDLLVLTNDDTGFSAGLTDTLLEVSTWAKPCAFAHRMDVDRSDKSLTSTLDGSKYPGVDLFAIGVKLWREWRTEFPDCVLGAEQWDLAMLALMRRVGAPELAGAIWHQPHVPGWIGPNAQKANQWNRLACGKWFDKQGVTAEQVIENVI